jgi:putative peptidoglycan lipid II flippase
MSTDAARGDEPAFRTTLGASLGLSAFVAVPAAVGLMTLAHPVVAMLFERGEFDAAATQRTAEALVGYAAGLPAFSTARIAAQAFYALGDTRTPVLTGFLALAVNVAVAIALMGPLGHAGLAWASSVSGYANALLLCWLLGRYRRMLPVGTLGRSLARTVGASVPLLAWCWWARAALGAGDDAFQTLAVIAGGAAAYAAGAWVLGAPEVRSLRAMLGRRTTLPGPEGE